MHFPHHVEEFCLPDFWAPYLINRDASGLTDADQAAVDAWWRENLPDGVPVSCVSCSEESDFRKYHDADQYVPACDCLTYSFLVHADPAHSTL